jgi:hypothetical protein
VQTKPKIADIFGSIDKYKEEYGPAISPSPYAIRDLIFDKIKSKYIK